MDKDQQTVLLEVKNLNVGFTNHNETTEAVKDIGFVLYKGQCLGIVGESGSGKSVTSLSILDLLRSDRTNFTKGSIIYHSERGEVDVLNVPQKILHEIRGRKISMVFQEPMSALNPVRKCGSQVKEVLDVHHMGDPKERKNKILSLFDKVALPEVERIYNSYPHELSGGQLQRVNIAMALATSPDIIICDEPTTALDMTVQKQIIELLKNLVEASDIALIFISHDLDVVGALCDSVVVMYQGEIVEQGDLPGTFINPQHKYTQALLACKPTVENRMFQLPTVEDIMADKYVPNDRSIRKSGDESSLIQVEGLKVYFPKHKSSIFDKRKYVKAVDNISFQLHNGEILGIVGESGSGKSTVANCIAGLISPTAGRILYKGAAISPEILSGDKKLRTRIQLVFQDPYSSLNPQMPIGQAITEPLRYHKIVPKSDIDHKLDELLQQVGLDSSYAERYPHQLSGGQRQRACIARSLAVHPDVLICDESVSALDVSIQAQILNLLDDLRNNLGLSMIFISHDLSVIHYICDYVLVMKDGIVVEEGLASDVMVNPQQPYTRQLVDSLPASIT